MPDFDACLVAYGNPAEIEAAVRSLASVDGLATVAVVDNLDGRAAAAAAGLGAATLHRPDNPGFGAGQNRAVALGEAPFVLLLNPDADLCPEGIAASLDLLASSPDVGAAQGVIVNRATGQAEHSQGTRIGPVALLARAVSARRLLRWAVVRAAVRRTTLRTHVDRIPGEPVEVDYLAATALVVRREAFEAVAGFDEGYFLYGEDADLGWRLRQAGWRLVALPEVAAIHTSGGAAGDPWRRELTWWQGTMRYAALWFTPAAWALAEVAAVLQAARLMARRPSGAREAWTAVVGEARVERGRRA